MTTPTTSGTARTAARKTTVSKPDSGTTTSGAPSSGTARQSSLQQHLAVVAEGEVLDPAALHAFLESWRALATGLAFFGHAAASQLEAAVRKGARNEADGRLTLQQKVELATVLRRVRRLMEGQCAEGMLASAKGAVSAWSRMEDFLDGLESDSVTRPHRSNRGGFRLSREG